MRRHSWKRSSSPTSDLNSQLPLQRWDPETVRKFRSRLLLHFGSIPVTSLPLLIASCCPTDVDFVLFSAPTHPIKPISCESDILQGDELSPNFPNIIVKSWRGDLFRFNLSFFLQTNRLFKIWLMQIWTSYLLLWNIYIFTNFKLKINDVHSSSEKDICVNVCTTNSKDNLLNPPLG